MVLWLGLHWSSIAELHHFLNISSVLEALNKFWIDRVYGSVKLETIYLLNYLNIFFPLCLLWLLCLGHSIYCTGLLIFFWKCLIFYEVSLKRRKTSERLTLIPFLSWQAQEWISSGNYRLRGQERVRAYAQNARLILASCEHYRYAICKTDSFIRPNLYGMSLCGISNPTSVAISSHIPSRRHHLKKKCTFCPEIHQLETLKQGFWKGSATPTMHSKDELWTVSMAWVRARSWKSLPFSAAQFWSPQAELRAITTQRQIRVSFTV